MPVTELETLTAQAVLDLASRSDDFDILDLLHDLTEHSVSLLALRSAGVTVLNEAGEVDYLTASDEACRRLEEEQIDLGEGPCLDSTRTRTPLAPTALAPAGPGRRRWPRFAPLALSAGITTVAAVPLRTPQHTLGALNLMRASRFGPWDLRLAQALADACATSLHYRQTLLSKDEIIDQLETALNTRIVIEQAKGALSARLGTDVDEAFTLLRNHARARRQKLRDLATQVAQGAVPAELDTAS